MCVQCITEAKVTALWDDKSTIVTVPLGKPDRYEYASIVRAIVAAGGLNALEFASISPGKTVQVIFAVFCSKCTAAVQISGSATFETARTFQPLQTAKFAAILGFTPGFFSRTIMDLIARAILDAV